MISHSVIGPLKKTSYPPQTHKIAQRISDEVADTCKYYLSSFLLIVIYYIAWSLLLHCSSCNGIWCHHCIQYMRIDIQYHICYNNAVTISVIYDTRNTLFAFFNVAWCIECFLHRLYTNSGLEFTEIIM